GIEMIDGTGRIQRYHGKAETEGSCQRYHGRLYLYRTNQVQKRTGQRRRGANGVRLAADPVLRTGKKSIHECRLLRLWSFNPQSFTVFSDMVFETILYDVNSFFK